jgi:phage FluMu protein Com
MKSKVQLKCYECGKQFKRTLGPRTFEVKCPRCKGYDVGVD